MIVITGPPRSGKNFILDIYKECDVTTAVIDAEHPLEGRPSVVKCAKFKRIIDSDRSIDQVFIMIRNIEDVVEDAIEAGISRDRRALTKKICARLGQIVYYCEMKDIDYETIHYPACLYQLEYLREKLDPGSDGIHTENFEQAWKRARRARV